LAYWPVCSLPLRQVRLASFCPRALFAQGPPRWVIPLLPPPFPVRFYIFSRLCFLRVQKRFSKKKKKKEKQKRKEQETPRRPSSPAPAMLLSRAHVFASARLSPHNPLLPSYFTAPCLVYPASLLTRLQPFASLSTSIYFFILSFFFFFFFFLLFSQWGEHHAPLSGLSMFPSLCLASEGCPLLRGTYLTLCVPIRQSRLSSPRSW
jgi:hypothetical protein